MIMKFNVIITSDKGQVFTTGNENGRVGKPIMPYSSYKLEYTPFGKAGPQDEFPKTCQIVDLQVCPYSPASPAKATASGAAAYYDAFHEGPIQGCRNAVTLAYVALPVPSVPSVGPKNTWLDPATNLTWTKNDNGSSVDWSQANTYCASLQLDGQSGWRLPTIDELQGIYDPGANGPFGKVNSNLSLTSDCEWSSTEGTGAGEGWLFVYSARQTGRRLFKESGSIAIAVASLANPVALQPEVGNSPPVPPRTRSREEQFDYIRRRSSALTPPCPACRMRNGFSKRSWPTRKWADEVWGRQHDRDTLRVYECPVQPGFWHLGHIRPAIASVVIPDENPILPCQLSVIPFETGGHA
jgi:Protein of unknown function (DUF1566)